MLILRRSPNGLTFINPTHGFSYLQLEKLLEIVWGLWGQIFWFFSKNFLSAIFLRKFSRISATKWISNVSKIVRWRSNNLRALDRINWLCCGRTPILRESPRGPELNICGAFSASLFFPLTRRSCAGPIRWRLIICSFRYLNILEKNFASNLEKILRFV